MDEINPFEFQRVIGRFIEHMGFEIESAKDIEDGSVDFKAKTKNPMGASIISLIRASTYTRLVADDDINSLNEAMGEAGAVRAAYITTSGFSNGAVEAARDKPISLINKYQLMESIEKRGLSSDTDFMESLDKLGMAEKHFQGVEQSFVNGVSESAAKAYFEGKGKRNEKPIRIRLRYAPVSVLKVVTTKDVWTSDQTLRSIEEKDYMFVNLNNLELYFITQRRKRNKTEKTLMRSDIIRKINDLPDAPKEHLIHLLEHGDLPVEDLEGKELSILKNKKVINIYEGRRRGASELTDYMQMFLEGLLETVTMIIDEILEGMTTMGEGGTEKAEPKPPKKVTAEVNMPHIYGGVYDIWKHVEAEKGLKSGSEVDPLIYSSKGVGGLLKSIMGGKVMSEGIIFMPYYRAKYMNEKSKKITKYEVLVAPRFKGEVEAPKVAHEVKAGPRIIARKTPIAGEFKLIK